MRNRIYSGEYFFSKMRKEIIQYEIYGRKFELICFWIVEENLYMSLEFEKQEELENMLRQDIEVFSENIEKILRSGCKV